MVDDYWSKVHDLIVDILVDAFEKDVQGTEIRSGNTEGHDVSIADDYTVVGGNVLSKVAVREQDMPYFLDYCEKAASLPRLLPTHYPFPHPDFESAGFSIRPVIDIDLFKQRIILLLRRY